MSEVDYQKIALYQKHNVIPAKDAQIQDLKKRVRQLEGVLSKHEIPIPQASPPSAPSRQQITTRFTLYLDHENYWLAGESLPKRVVETEEICKADWLNSDYMERLESGEQITVEFSSGSVWYSIPDLQDGIPVD